MNKPTQNTNMNTRYAQAVCDYDSTLRFHILHSQNQGLDEIRISIPVAKEMLRDIEILKKSIEAHRPIERRDPQYFARLDAIFEEQASVMNTALSKILK